MTVSPQKFVDALAAHCRDAAVSDCISAYERPRGRQPSERLVRLSHWFRSLPSVDRRMVVAAMDDAADGTLFGVLSALDGVRPIDDEGHRFVVLCDLDGVRQDVSSPAIDLHDLLDQPQGD